MAFAYPAFLDVQGVEVLVVGGGVIAFRKASGLAEAGALAHMGSLFLSDRSDDPIPRGGQRYWAVVPAVGMAGWPSLR